MNEQMRDERGKERAGSSHAVPIGHGTQNGCFGCGDANPAGLRLRFYAGAGTARDHAPHSEDAGRIDVHCRLALDIRFQGPPGYAHGGIIATLLDEAMSKANRRRGVSAMTRQMSVDYLRPVPINAELLLEGTAQKEGSRKHRCTATLRDAAGRVLASATGLFIEVRPERLLHANTHAGDARR